MAPTPKERAELIWPGIDFRNDIMCAGPLGSRNDDAEILLYNRRTRQVSTGWVNDHACFLGSFEEFVAAVEKKYGSDWAASNLARPGREYQLAIAFLQGLPDIE